MAILSDKDYQARWDAESLATAETIKADPARLNKAQDAATKMAEEKRKELNGINRVANRAKRSKTAQKPTSKTINKTKARPKAYKAQPKPQQPTVTGNGSGFNVFKKI